MDYKEKLALAKEALDSGSYDKETIEYIFPELVESEDEQHRKWILEYLYDGLRKSDEQFKGQFKAAIAWLEKQGKNNMGISESIKQELKDNLNNALENETTESWNEFLDEQKSVLNEKDEENFNWFDKFFRNESVFNEGKDIPQDRYIWFKNLKDRVQPQLKQEWSKEDEKMIENIRRIIAQDAFYNDAVDVNGELCEKMYIDADNWLKLLKDKIQPNSIWKPSNEQMHYLYWIANINLGDSLVEQEVSKHLNELYEDLKKLKE